MEGKVKKKKQRSRVGYVSIKHPKKHTSGCWANLTLLDCLDLAVIVFWREGKMVKTQDEGERERERGTDRQRGRVSEFWTHILIIRPLSRGSFWSFQLYEIWEKAEQERKEGRRWGIF